MPDHAERIRVREVENFQRSLTGIVEDGALYSVLPGGFVGGCALVPALQPPVVACERLLRSKRFRYVLARVTAAVGFSDTTVVADFLLRPIVPDGCGCTVAA